MPISSWTLMSSLNQTAIRQRKQRHWPTILGISNRHQPTKIGDSAHKSWIFQGIFKGPDGELITLLPCFAHILPIFHPQKKGTHSAATWSTVGAPRPRPRHPRLLATDPRLHTPSWPRCSWRSWRSSQDRQIPHSKGFKMKTSSGDLGCIFVWFLTCTYIIIYINIYILYLFICWFIDAKVDVYWPWSILMMCSLILEWIECHSLFKK